VRYAVLADVHGNLEALEAVLADVDCGFAGAALVVAGDIVGYGPDPEACLWRLHERRAVMVRGNHEEMVLGLRGYERCVHAGIVAARWTERQLSPAALAALANLPPVARLTDRVVVCHGNLASADVYIADVAAAARALMQLEQGYAGAELLIAGHTHRAAVFTASSGGPADGDVGLPRAACVLNPGAVGQARQGEAVAAYAWLDLERRVVQFRRLPYDHARTEHKLRAAGLVDRVVLSQPAGVWRSVERWRTRWARL
jgi:predicted phosphodiesterase